MNHNMRYIALMMFALALTACDSTTTTAHHATVARTTTLPSAGPSASALDVSQPLTCGTDVDTSQAGTPLTVTEMIGNLDAVFLTEGILSFHDGNLSDTATSVLIKAGGDFDGYSGNKLSDDATAFSQDETGYNPGPDPSEEDTSYATALTGDIVKLTADCPKAYKIAKKLTGR